MKQNNTHLLNRWLSTFSFEKARKSSGSSITGIVTCISSFIWNCMLYWVKRHNWTDCSHSPCGLCPTSRQTGTVHSPWISWLSGVSLENASFWVLRGPGQCLVETFWQVQFVYSRSVLIQLNRIRHDHFLCSRLWFTMCIVY